MSSEPGAGAGAVAAAGAAAAGASPPVASDAGHPKHEHMMPCPAEIRVMFSHFQRSMRANKGNNQPSASTLLISDKTV